MMSCPERLMSSLASLAGICTLWDVVDADGGAGVLSESLAELVELGV